MLMSLLAMLLVAAPVSVAPQFDDSGAASVLEAMGADNEVSVSFSPDDAELDSSDRDEPVISQSLATSPERKAQPRVAAPSRHNLDCVAMAIYFEARGEPLRGQKAVSDVIMNRWRARGLPSACAVTTQRGQFSNRSRWRIGTGESWQRAVSIASASLDGITHISSAIQYFHATSVRPNWGRRARLKIGNHIFY